MEAPRRWCHTGARDGDHGAIPVRTMEIMVHDVKDHIASHKYNVHSLCFLIYACILDIRDFSINKMIPLLVPTNMFPL